MVFEYLTDNEKVYWLNYLARMAELYQEKINQLSNAKGGSGINQKRILLLKEVNLFYKNICTKIQESLYGLVTKDLFLSKDVLSFSYEDMTAFSFSYLIRDWSQNEAYNQRTIIISFIEKKLEEIAVNNQDKALFFGCGTGRYAVDLAHRYNQVEAFDASFFMLWSIEYLQEIKTWDILQKIDRNCRKIDDTIQRVRLEMTEEQASVIEEKINFFLADAANVPLPKDSIDHIYSIYFTDVLPLAVLFEEVNRLLKKEGLFIHFGPLEYFFNTEHEMLSAEEVRLFFEKKGYHILRDEFLETRHLYLPNKMRYRVYDNWFFIAQKTANGASKQITNTDILRLNNQVDLEVKAVVEEGQCTTQTYAVSLGNQSYNLPHVVYELLLNINGISSMVNIFQKMNLEDVIDEDKEELMSILDELLAAGIVQFSAN